MRKISKLKKYIRDNFDIEWEYHPSLKTRYKVVITKNQQLLLAYGSIRTLCKRPFTKYIYKHGISDFYSCICPVFEDIAPTIHSDTPKGFYRGLANLGFSPKENRWYGWANLQIYSFTIGSEVKKGDCAYRAPNCEEFIEHMIQFYGPKPEDIDSFYVTSNILDDEKFEIVIHYVNVQNKKLNGTTKTHTICFPKEYGRGEWKADTIEDARQMAIDFVYGISRI